MKDRINWTKWASVAICSAAGAVLVWLVLRYALGIVLPIALAWLLSRIICKPTAAIHRYTRIPRGAVAAVLVVALVGGAVWGIVAGVRRGIDELSLLLDSLATEPSSLMNTLREIMGGVYSLSSHLPFLSRFEDTPGFAEFCLRLDELAAAATERLVSSLSARLPSLAMSVAGRLPSVFLFVAVTLLSCYYFTADDRLTGRIGESLCRLLPDGVAARLPTWRTRLSRSLR
jgi:predicted PurR-regulated permease PerM